MEGEELTETELGRNKPTASQFVPQAGLGLGIGCLSVHEEIQSPVMSFRFFFGVAAFPRSAILGTGQRPPTSQVHRLRLRDEQS